MEIIRLMLAAILCAQRRDFLLNLQNVIKCGLIFTEMDFGENRYVKVSRLFYRRLEHLRQITFMIAVELSDGGKSTNQYLKIHCRINKSSDKYSAGMIPKDIFELEVIKWIYVSVYVPSTFCLFIFWR